MSWDDGRAHEPLTMQFVGGQPDIRFHEARAWAAQKGVALTIFQDWATLMRQVLLWSATPTLEGARKFPRIVQERLVAMEASEEAVESWVKRFETLIVRFRVQDDTASVSRFIFDVGIHPNCRIAG